MFREAGRGGDVENILTFTTRYPGVEQISIEENFRSSEGIAKLAGKLDAEQHSRGIVLPFADLLIGATALSLGYSVLTVLPLFTVVLLSGGIVRSLS